MSINLFFEAPAMFKEMMPNDFEKYVYASQLLQAYGKKRAFVRWK